MKFVDSAEITVIAGDGGNGYINFRKNRKNNWLKKPNSSKGGKGGDVCLLADTTKTTLEYFRFNHIFKAEHGCQGCHNNRTGKRGKDLIIKVPVGTRVYCQKTYELLGDMLNSHDNNTLIVAKGGLPSSENYYFNRYLRKDNVNLNQCSSLYKNKGEFRHLLLELILTANVGLFGLPNSGKSSFLSIVSQAKPKIAHYPFTTLTPNLGAVKINNHDAPFIIVDIPGITKGASEGLGLGTQFLKHLKRCQILLHFVDINPLDKSDPIENILIVEKELFSYDVNLVSKVRWLIFNKIDLVNGYELKIKINHIIQSISWKDRYYAISVVHKTNITSLCYDIMMFINNHIIDNNT